MSTVRYVIGDVRARLAELPAGSVDLVVTSWPYWLQRAYMPVDHPDKQFEIGQEPTVADYLDTLLDVTAHLGRVLAPHGSIAMELADTFSGSGGAGGDYQPGVFRDGQPVWTGSAHAAKSRHSIDNPARGKRPEARRLDEYDGGALRDRAADEHAGIVPRRDRKKHDGICGVIPPDKSLCMVPELYRIALAYGVNPLRAVGVSPAGMWRCRNVVLHCRPNPSVGDDGDKFRPGKSDWVIATRARNRWWDGFGVRVPAKDDGYTRQTNGRKARSLDEGWDERKTANITTRTTGDTSPLLDHWWEDDPRLDRFDVEAWPLSTHPYKGAHFATFSPKLITPLILAMCPERVCTTCGEPARRITERTNAMGVGTLRSRQPGHERAFKSTADPDYTAYEDLGWTDCGHDTWRNGLVLDPFGGSGTTGMVASGHGRDAILIDLDDRNIDLARERVGMFLEVAS